MTPAGWTKPRWQSFLSDAVADLVARGTSGTREALRHHLEIAAGAEVDDDDLSEALASVGDHARRAFR